MTVGVKQNKARLTLSMGDRCGNCRTAGFLLIPFNYVVKHMYIHVEYCEKKKQHTVENTCSMLMCGIKKRQYIHMRFLSIFCVNKGINIWNAKIVTGE